MDLPGPNEPAAVLEWAPIAVTDARIPKVLKLRPGWHAPITPETVNPFLCFIPCHVSVGAHPPVKAVVLKRILTFGDATMVNVRTHAVAVTEEDEKTGSNSHVPSKTHENPHSPGLMKVNKKRCIPCSAKSRR